MNIDIRKSIINNFKDVNDDELISTIKNSLQEQEEATLPGLGVFFELLWQNSNESDHKFIIDTIKRSL